MRFLIPTLLILFLLAACGGQPSTSVVGQEIPPTLVPQVEQTTVPTQVPTTISATEVFAATEASPGEALEAFDCLGGEVSPIGQSIAEDYEFTSYEEVITWFCEGAEFEDVLLALETESQTGTPAEEMLQMLADGFNWEEIWQLTGLTE